MGEHIMTGSTFCTKQFLKSKRMSIPKFVVGHTLRQKKRRKKKVMARPTKRVFSSAIVYCTAFQ